jgi:hypothetical protein
MVFIAPLMVKPRTGKAIPFSFFFIGTFVAQIIFRSRNKFSRTVLGQVMAKTLP